MIGKDWIHQQFYQIATVLDARAVDAGVPVAGVPIASVPVDAAGCATATKGRKKKGTYTSTEDLLGKFFY